MALRFEVWSRPDSGTFERKFPLPQLTQYRLQHGMFGQGIAVLPSNLPRLDDILYRDPSTPANDKASIIRAYIGDQHLYDFWSTRLPVNANETDTRTGTVSGGGAGTRLTKTKVRQKDYPLTPSVEPDWRYGFGPQLVTNGDITYKNDGVLNPGAEDETTLGWFTTDTVGRGYPDYFDAVYDPPGAHSGDWYFEFEGSWAEGAVQDFPTTGYTTGLSPNEVWNGYRYEVGVWCKAPVGAVYRLEVHGAETVSTGVQFDNQARADAVGTGAWQYLFIAMNADQTGGGQVRVISLSATNIVVQFDDVKVDGFGLGVEPFQARGNMTLFEGSPLQAHSGTHSIKWRPGSGIAGNESVYQACQVVPGQTVHAGGWLYHSEPGNRNFRLVIRKPGVDPNTDNVASVPIVVPPSTWTYVAAEGESLLPTVDVEFRFDENYVPGDLFLDDVTMSQGRAEATAGEILRDQWLDASTNHAPAREALAWLTPTWTNTLTSGGLAWDQTIAMTVKRGQSMRRLVDRLVNDFGYETRIRVNPADDTVLWWDLYNPGEMGTDWTLTDGGAVTSSGLYSFGPIVRREPRASYGMVEGAELYWGEDLDTAIQSVWGDIEEYEGSDELLEGTLDSVAAGVTGNDNAEVVIVKFVAPDRIPGIDYVIGDWVQLTLGDEWLPSGRYRVIDIAYESGDPEPIIQVQFEAAP